MIANLITTLLLALGVATGSYQSESGNAFNHEKQKPIQKATEVVPISINKQYERLQTYDYSDSYYNYKSKKYCIANDNNSNYYTGYMLIANTEYEFIMDRTANNVEIAKLYSVYEIYNYYNSEISIDLTMNIEYSQAVGNYYNRYNIIYEYSNVDDTITNLTLNSTTMDTLANFLNRNATQIANNSSAIVDTQPTLTQQWNNIIIQANSSYKICFYLEVNDGNVSQEITTLKPTQFELSGTAVVPTVSQEIVNVPELMFTIITLPFAFYSTAFNLTIFPNTPYALNFGNLILTIIAALVLLYLIKKVLK